MPNTMSFLVPVVSFPRMHGNRVQYASVSKSRNVDSKKGGG